MRRTSRSRLPVLSLLTALLFPAAGAQPSLTLRLGYFPNLTHAPALVGLERGTFQKALRQAGPGGARLVATSFASGPALMEAFAAGQLDLAYVGPGPAINAATRGMPLQVVAGASEAGAVLVARKGSGITTPRGLAGKRVAVPSLGNTQDISLRHLLQEQGLKAQTDGGSVTVTPIAPADVLAAFAANRVDAALVPEPWGAALEAQGHRVIGSEKTVWRGGRYPSTLLVVNTRFAAAHPELVRAFVGAHAEAVAFLNTKPVAALALVNRQLGKLTGQALDPRTLQRALNRTRFTTALDPAALNEYAALNVAAGYARSAADLKTYINTRFLK